MAGALAGIRVVECAEGVAGPYCGKLLAGLGADVLKLESPARDWTRREGPFPGDIPHAEKSGLFLHLNSGKRSAIAERGPAPSLLAAPGSRIRPACRTAGAAGGTTRRTAVPDSPRDRCSPAARTPAGHSPVRCNWTAAGSPAAVGRQAAVSSPAVESWGVPRSRCMPGYSAGPRSRCRRGCSAGPDSRVGHPATRWEGPHRHREKEPVRPRSGAFRRSQRRELSC